MTNDPIDGALLTQIVKTLIHDMTQVGEEVQSLRDQNLHGKVVGVGYLTWPASDQVEGDGEPQLVYLVKVANGSSSLGVACRVFRYDQLREMETPEGTANDEKEK